MSQPPIQRTANTKPPGLPQRSPKRLLNDPPNSNPSSVDKRPRYLGYNNNPSRAGASNNPQNACSQTEDLSSDNIAKMFKRALLDPPRSREVNGRVFSGTSDIREFDFEFDEKNRVGSGTFGVVLQGKHKATGRSVALKRIVMNGKWSEEGVTQIVI